MITKDAYEIPLSPGEKETPIHFSEWIKRRRQELDLTQEQLAQRACCSVFAIRKIEMGERRPSKQLAGLLAQALELPEEDQDPFIKVARGELSLDRLAKPAKMPADRASTTEKPGAVSGSLPRALTPFIGREPELAALGKLLGNPQCRLLTITGPGGIGKTRLAVSAAEEARELFFDGVWFIPLAALHSPDLLVPVIAEAMLFKFQDPANPQMQLLRYLRSKQALLVLDNAEHLLEGVGVFGEILQDCPQVKLLVTSRERLNLLSEWVFEIQGLPLPPSAQAEQFEIYSAVALFLQSARRVQAGFEIQEADRKWVIQICQKLEGMPLGIELSAAWVGLLSCEEIAREIEHSLDFLSVSMRDLPERQRSLRVTLDHSWKLLDGKEQLVLRRLSVFRGSFSLEAAQEICGATLVLLSSLRNKCLLYRIEQGLYHLHEVIRQYAGRKLAEDPEENERVNNQHAVYYVQRLAKWEKALQSSQQPETLNEMARVIDNLSQGWRKMISHCLCRSEDGCLVYSEMLHQALFSLSLFYEMRFRSLEAISLFAESVEYLQTVQHEFEGTEYYRSFVSVLGDITTHLGLHYGYVLQPAKVIEYLEKGALLLEAGQARVKKAQAQLWLSSFYFIMGELHKSLALNKQCLDIFLEEGEEWWYLLSLNYLARSKSYLGKYEESEALYLEGLRRVEPGDYRLNISLRMGFAHLRFLLHDYVQAEQLLLDNLRLIEQYNLIWLRNSIVIHLSQVLLATQRVDLAENYLQESYLLFHDLGDTIELAKTLLYLGKCYAARLNIELALEKFWQLVKIGQELDAFYLVYWGLVNIARVYMNAGQIGQAREISRLIENCTVEHKQAQAEADALLADLRAALTDGQMDGIFNQVDKIVSQEQARSIILAYVQEHASG